MIAHGCFGGRVQGQNPKTPPPCVKPKTMHCRCSTWNILLDTIGDLCHHDPIVRCHRGRGRPRREQAAARANPRGLHPAHHHEHGGHWPNVMQPRHGRHRQGQIVREVDASAATQVLSDRTHPHSACSTSPRACHVEPTGKTTATSSPRHGPRCWPLTSLLARRCGGTLDRTGPLRRGQDTARHGSPRQGRGPHQRHLPQRLDAHRGETIRGGAQVNVPRLASQSNWKSLVPKAAG